MSNRAIMIPYNPHVDLEGGTGAGSLFAHKFFADRHGAVYWDLVNASPHNDIEVAYFYDPEERAVTYKAKVELIESKENLKEQERSYVPNFRISSWDGKQWRGEVWLKLKEILPLRRKHKLSNFKKVSDGKPLQIVRNFAIVKDPRFATKNEELSFDMFMDEHLYRLLSQVHEKLKEADIEEMLWLRMMERNLEFVERQKGNKDRLDIAFRRGNEYVVVEIKRGTADLETLEQIKRYVQKIEKERKPSKLNGIILCRKANISLQRAVEKEKGVSIDQIKFSASFPKIEELLNDQ